jgi:hypothetical protein
VTSTREFLQLWKIWPRAKGLYIFYSGQGKHTAHVEKRGTTEGKKPRGWCGPYKRVRTRFQYMYVGCSGNSRVCTRVAVGTVHVCTQVPGRTVAYVRTCSFQHEQVRTC